MLQFIPFPELKLLDLFLQLQDGVDRAFLGTCHVAGNVSYPLEVFMIDAFFRILFGDMDQGTQGHEGAVGSRYADAQQGVRM